VSLLIEGAFRQRYGVSGQPFQVPDSLSGGIDVGFMFLPNYRLWVITASLGVCIAIWYIIERTRLGSYLRAGTENPVLVQAFGINIRRMITLTYMLGVGLAAFAGVLAAPIYQVSSIMGANIIPVIFAVVVIGGMGSIMGSIVTGFLLGLIEAFTRLLYPQASAVVIFVVMVVVLLIRPQGLFGVRS
jgi:branched-chain amino acid transport system permease protein